MRIEGLVNGRRLMDTACYRLEVVYAECVWIIAAVPSHNIERMIGVPEVVQQSFFLYLYQEFPGFIDGDQVLWLAYVAFAKRRMLQQLAIPALVPLWEGYRTK